MRQRVIFLLKTYLWTVLVFIIAKVVFMLCCHEGHFFTIADVWQVVTHGLTLDLSTSLYILALPFLLTMVCVWWQHRVLGQILKGYFALIGIALALAFVADTSLYPFWNFKLDSSCLQYLETPTEAMASVSTGYLIVRAVVFIAVALILFKGFPRFPAVHGIPKRSLRISETLFYVLCIPLIVIGIRGGVDESTTNIGQVYYSQDQFLNHSAVNPLFSFLSSIEKTASYIPDYAFMDEAEREELMRRGSRMAPTSHSIGTWSCFS